jgi:hypothetical protein
MRVFAIRIEYALDVAIQRRHDPDPREHRRPSQRRQASRLPWQSAIKKMKAQRSVIQPQPNNWDRELIDFEPPMLEPPFADEGLALSETGQAWRRVTGKANWPKNIGDCVISIVKPPTRDDETPLRQ